MNNKDTVEAPERIWMELRHFRSRSMLVGDPALSKRSESDIEYARVDPPAAPTDGVEIIRVERQRHFDVEGWTPEHDDEHVNGEIAQAAACYAWPTPRPAIVKKAWPWELQDWKPELFGVGADDAEKREARVRALAKAGALIAAEIDRLRRIK